MIAAFAAIVFATIAFVMGGVFGIAGGVALLIGAGASFCIAGHLLSDPSPSLSRNDMAYFSPEQIAQQRHLQELRKAQIEAFNKTLAEQGLEVKECGGGGDCLFHSLYYHFGRMAKLKDHKAVREKVVAHMESHPDDFKSYVEHSEFKQIEKLESRDGHDLNLDKYKAYFDFMMKKGLLTNTQKRTFQQKIDDSTSSVKAVTDEDVLDIRLKAYIALMNRTGEWGGEQEVKAFASYLAEHGHLIRIVVHSPENNGYLTCYPPGTERNTEYHLLRNGNHWQALVPKKSS
ncbi:MAG: hypothetical protein KDK62_00480 [Chlamydiia bacterium]|nr:hypothetical protein [Chlamydiia bacterium]